MFRISIAPAALAANKLLACLPGAAAERLQPHLHEVNLLQHETVYDIGEEVRHVYFPAGAVVAGVLLMNDGTMVETSLIGCEGVAGVGAALGDHRSGNWMRVLLPGRALKVRGDLLREFFHDDGDLQRLLLLYYRIRINHVSHRAVCNSRHRIQERLATWLLMLDDRAASAEIPLTQEMIARQMGVRRAGVNECLGELQRAGAVENMRCRLRVHDRQMLEHSACACYRTFADEVEWYKAFKPGGGARPSRPSSPRATFAPVARRGSVE
jgi:CRP-like cAMP-binding protein